MQLLRDLGRCLAWLAGHPTAHAVPGGAAPGPRPAGQPAGAPAAGTPAAVVYSVYIYETQLRQLTGLIREAIVTSRGELRERWTVAGEVIYCRPYEAREQHGVYEIELTPRALQCLLGHIRKWLDIQANHNRARGYHVVLMRAWLMELEHLEPLILS